MRLFTIVLWVIFFAVSCSEPSTKKVKIQGETQGTYYVVTYYDPEGTNFQNEIEFQLAAFDTIASMWVKQSLISRINRNETSTTINPDFTQLYNQSKEIYNASGGAFDPTVGPLVNAWGFGFTDRMKVDSAVVDSLLPLVGFKRVTLENGQIQKEDPRIQFDFNAIAQGYAVDLIGKFLESKGISDYLIDIGGEVLGRGSKPNNETWKVGIEKPADNAQYGDALEAIVSLKNKALATSGNYRKFYEEDGVRYSHTIDPVTGYPVTHSILSVSVLASDCASADGWATACMVLGLQKSLELIKSRSELEAFFIYSDSTDGTMKTIYSEGFGQYLEEMPQ
ncbi:MAG: FAD:protein FMN transferase [Bacteroidales bacterium]|nr:FAD:protein FMN transferase [Bacteroidales bacterium]